MVPSPNISNNYIILHKIKSPQALYPAIVIICLCIKVIVAKMSGKKMTEGQITILNQILIISMHVASLVKRPCYLLKFRPEMKIWACLVQITP